MHQNDSEPMLLLRDQYIGQTATLFASPRTLDHDYALHTHDFFEIELICTGHGTHLLNGHAHPLSPGSIYLLTPADMHAVHPAEPLTYYNAMFSEEFFSDDFAYEMLLSCRGVQVELSRAEQTRVQSLFCQLIEEAAQPADRYAHSYMRSLLQCILIVLLRRTAPEQEPPRPAHSIRPALFYLQRHFRESVTLEQAAESVHLSPNYFCELFRAETGRSFCDYVNELRVRYARRLLISGNASVTDICYQSGFRSFSSFSREFRKLFQVSPSQLRKNTNPAQRNKSVPGESSEHIRAKKIF